MRPFAPCGSALDFLRSLHVADRTLAAATRTLGTTPLRRACFLRGHQPWRPLTLNASPASRGYTSSAFRRFTTTAHVRDEASRKVGEELRREGKEQDTAFPTAHSPHSTTQPPSQPQDVTTETASTPSTEPSSPSSPSLDDAAQPPSSEPLPSHREKQRWDTTKNVSQWMETLQENLALATQKLNNYTGTDYSGIQALRAQIATQEADVKSRRLAITEAKTLLDLAFSQKTASQKEVVGLLERKHSWSDADLERYMSLVRSEHLNDQAVQNAKDRVQDAEHGLEETRAQLEKLERKQYHEEQIWSDTIRRNSTWVTFGLMGFNILVLLASIAILEPWRRRRLVREMKTALEDHKASLGTLQGAPAPVVVADQVAQLESPPVDETPLPPAVEHVPVPVPVPQPTDSPLEEVPPAAVLEPLTPIQSPLPPPTPDEEEEEPRTPLLAALQSALPARITSLFSSTPTTLRTVDLTTYTLSAFSLGAALASFVAVLWCGK